MRARITEEDEPEVARAKLRETLAAIVLAPDERSLLEPRLAHLLGLAERSAPDKEDLFSAWRLFFERMADRNPVVLVFEDLQWADEGLLDFIEYLLDWSRAYPIYVVTLARPELAERRSAWGAGRRDFTSLFLDPLEPRYVEEFLHGLAPGLPDELRARIVERAEGVPLYAVETVRMLLGRGLLKRSADGYRPTGPIETLAIPETLQSLAAARLDSLESDERRLLSDAAVLGRTFSRAGLAALSGLTEEELEPHLQSLLRKEILTVQLDPLSPERNQLSFVQDLLRRVAYETLSVRERKARHLAVAAHLGDDEDVAAVVAAHYLDAYRAGPSDPDAPELRTKARVALTRAAERAASLASAAEAASYFGQAAELAEEPLERAELLERSGRAAMQGGNIDQADEVLKQAIELLEERGEQHAAARVSARRADVLRMDDRIDEAFELMLSAYDALGGSEPDTDLALVAAQLARLAYFAGDRERAIEAVEVALDMAEALRAPEVLAEALTTKATVGWQHPHEAEALLREALRLAIANDLPAAALRAQFNLSGLAIEHSRFGEARSILEEALTLARVRGDRSWEAMLVSQLADALVNLGEWDEAEALCRGISVEGRQRQFARGLLVHTLARILIGRGEVDELPPFLANAGLVTSSDRQTRAASLMAEAALRNAEGQPREALAAAVEALEQWRALNQFHYLTEALVEAADAAFELDDLERVESLLAMAEELTPVQRRPLLDAQTARIVAKLAARRGEPADDGFEFATRKFHDLEMPFWVAVTLLEHAEHRFRTGRAEEGEPLLAEADGIFERLRAEPWRRRARRVREIEVASI